MLTDTRLRHLKPKEKLYKVNDRDGLYVAATPAGTISFRYNYSINGRQETVNGAAEYQTMKRSSNSSRVQQTIGGELATQIRKQTAARRDNLEHDDFAVIAYPVIINLESRVLVNEVVRADASLSELYCCHLKEEPCP